MDDVSAFLVQHGLVLVAAVVFAEQAGLPIPAVPLLLAAGALAGAGRLNLVAVVLLSVAGCLAGDLIWYGLGRHRGRQALNLLCRIALEPDSCVRRTENFFTRHGIRALVLAKFVPGLNTLAPALAGLFGIRLTRFLTYNGLGALLWTLAFVLPGYAFSSRLEALVAQEARLGSFLLAAIGVALVAYLGYKLVHRRWLLRELRIARITADELKRRMDEGGEVFVVDLRSAPDHEADPVTIPGALPMTAEELEQRHHEIPRHGDVILFCACPNEATAAKMALMLRRKGITRVRPLAGGLEAWRERAFPLAPRAASPARVNAGPA